MPPTWETLPSVERARITKAVVDAISQKLAAMANCDDLTPEPPEVCGVAVIGSDEDYTVHFVADKMLRSASVGSSDSAAHLIYVGRAVTGSNRPVTIQLTSKHLEDLSELEDAEYVPLRVVQRVREQVLARVQGVPVPPASDEGARAKKLVDQRARETEHQRRLANPEPTLVIRCPRCGSTRARATDSIEEFTVMNCPACALRAFIDQDQFSTDWCVHIVLAPGEDTPAFLPPLPPPVEGGDVKDETPVPTPMAAVPTTRVAWRPSKIVPYNDLGANETGENWTKDVTDPPLRCPRCDSTEVYDDTGRAERHFTFLSCRRCDHGEELNSLSAIGRWRRV